MSLTQELIIASELLLYPSEHAPTAVAELRSDDFLEPRCRLVYDGVTALWKRYPSIAVGDALEVVVGLAERRYRATRSEGFGCAEWVLEQSEAKLYDEFVAEYPRPFLDRCQALAGNSLIRRVRQKIGAMYISLSGAHPAGYTMPREYTDGLSARRVIDGLLDDIQGELARTRSGSIHTG